MQIHNLKKNIAWTLLVLLMVTGMSWGGTVYATEHEEANPPAGGEAEETTALQAELTEAERQAKLAQIGQQLKEAERKLIRLSLLVAKLALEEQVLVLQEELAIARVQTKAVLQGETGIAAVDLSSLEDQEEISLEGVLSQDVDKERGEEFLAALGPLRNLGTPELAALTILAVLGLFILVRRFRKRKPRLTENVPMKVPEDQPEASSQPQGNVFQ